MSARKVLIVATSIGSLAPRVLREDPGNEAGIDCFVSARHCMCMTRRRYC